MIKNKLYIILLPLLISGCVSRISRPYITGIVYDSISLKPLKDMEVMTWNNESNNYKTETKTNYEGKFFLKQQRYKDFTFIGNEAPKQSGQTHTFRANTL